MKKKLLMKNMLNSKNYKRIGSMKRICVTFATALISTATFSQVEPTTVKNEHLKGNVLSVAYTKYDYKENFGEPTEGKIQEQSAIILAMLV